jgi:hypothetical protein
MLLRFFVVVDVPKPLLSVAFPAEMRADGRLNETQNGAAVTSVCKVLHCNHSGSERLGLDGSSHPLHLDVEPLERLSDSSFTR